MDVIIPDSWLREYLDTTATPAKIAEYLSLCGPSFERVDKIGSDYNYHIEVTTNRVDSAGVFGIAREAAAILPRFKIQAKLVNLKIKASQPFAKSVSYLKASVDHSLCSRFTSVLIRDVKLRPSTNFIANRLKLVGLRPINNIVDISNYLMHELGQPVHTFDYDKIDNGTMILRASKKGEKITTLDGKNHILSGDDIVIEDGSGKLIDLAGIMGGKNSAVDENTKNVLLFVQTYNPVNIRRTSMSLAKRSEAGSLFEKTLDPELVGPTIRRGIDLFVKWTGGKPEKEILDIFPAPYKEKVVKTAHSFITQKLGVNLDKKEISNVLTSLRFNASWIGEALEVGIPSWRAHDMNIPEDVVEEIARIYGYHNLPSQLMPGVIPYPLSDSPFDFETKAKLALKALGGTEIYTLSLVPYERASVEGVEPLKLKNPLGNDSAYLRTTLEQSLVWAADENLGTFDMFHLFEMANVYLPRKGSLPEEKMTLAGIFTNYDYREAKGIIESLLNQLNCNGLSVIASEVKQSLEFENGKEKVGELTVAASGSIYYEFDMQLLKRASSSNTHYNPIPKYPAQIEDLSLTIPERVYMSSVTNEILKTDEQVTSVELIDIYNDSKTLRVTYQNPNKTLTDAEVAKIRGRVLSGLKQKFGVRPKESSPA